MNPGASNFTNCRVEISGSFQVEYTAADVEHEPGEFGIAVDGFGVLEDFGFGAGAVDVNLAEERIDEPAQCNTVLDPLLHFGLLGLQRIGLRTHFDDEMGRKRDPMRSLTGGW